MNDKAWNATLEIIKMGNIAIDLDDCVQAEYVARYFHRLYETLKMVEDGTFSERLKEQSKNS